MREVEEAMAMMKRWACFIIAANMSQSALEVFGVEGVALAYVAGL